MDNCVCELSKLRSSHRVWVSWFHSRFTVYRVVFVIFSEFDSRHNIQSHRAVFTSSHWVWMLLFAYYFALNQYICYIAPVGLSWSMRIHGPLCVCSMRICCACGYLDVWFMASRVHVHRCIKEARFMMNHHTMIHCNVNHGY
jgi:hypothetical protein